MSIGGVGAVRIRAPGEINRELIAKILESGRPTALHVKIDPNEVAA